MRAGLIAIAVVGAATSLVVSCSLLVPSDLPAYRCTGGDPSSCPPTMVCDEARELCVTPREPLPDDPAADADLDADTEVVDGGTDSAPTRSAVGGGCIADRDCEAPLLCGTTKLLSTAIIATDEDHGACTTPCCRSEDCPPSFVCFSPGTGGNYCVSARRAQRSSPGAKGAGKECAAGHECRSGLCEEGLCLDTCCTGDDCPAEGTTCRVMNNALTNKSMWGCAPPNDGATAEAGADCGGGVACMNDNCTGFPSPKCQPPCCSSSQCDGRDVCAYGHDVTPGFSMTSLRWCFPPNTAPDAGEVGKACEKDPDCLSRLCDQATRQCADACCTDRDCVEGMACRPSPNEPAVLRCVAVRPTSL